MILCSCLKSLGLQLWAKVIAFFDVDTKILLEKGDYSGDTNMDQSGLQITKLCLMGGWSNDDLNYRLNGPFLGKHLNNRLSSLFEWSDLLV